MPKRLARDLSRAEKVELSELLRNVEIFKELGRDRLAQVVDQLEQKEWKPGEQIIHKGSQGDKFYLVREGTVSIGDVDSDIRMNQGKYFGEVALLENKERNADVFACEGGPVVTFALSRTDFDKIFGVYGKQYKSWYKAVRDLQKVRKKEGKMGTLDFDDLGDLKTKLKKELKQKKLNTDLSDSDLEQICRNLINELGQDEETSENDFIAGMLADEKRENLAKLGRLLPGTPVSFLVIAGSITVYIYDTLTTPGCGLEETGPMEYNWTIGTDFHLTEEMLQRSVGCGFIADYFTAYPNEYYDKFDYSVAMVPTRLFSWCLGHADFDSLRMNMLFMLFLGIEAETLHGGWQLLHMFLVTALTGGIYTLCFANGAMLGAESLVYALIALLFVHIKDQMALTRDIPKHQKTCVTQIIGCLLFIGIQVRVLYTEYSRDLEDGVSQTGHIVAGTMGVMSWWLIHNRSSVLTWADTTVVEKFRADLAERKKRQKEAAAKERKRLEKELEPEARRLFRDIDEDGNEVGPDRHLPLSPDI